MKLIQARFLLLAYDDGVVLVLSEGWFPHPLFPGWRASINGWRKTQAVHPQYCLLAVFKIVMFKCFPHLIVLNGS